jgi:two-component system cell cycle sensor histidine kinase/response regulator CckA
LGELILVVDDEVSILQITRQTLEAFGYRVLTAEDGAQAIATFAAHRDEVALVLTDMMMPVMDGAALIAALRRLQPGISIVAVSGINAAMGAAQLSELKVGDFIAKPFTAPRLLDVVQRVLAGKKTRAAT